MDVGGGESKQPAALVALANRALQGVRAPKEALRVLHPAHGEEPTDRGAARRHLGAVGKMLVDLGNLNGAETGALADLAERGDIAGARAAKAEVAALGDGIERHLAAEAGDELLGAGAEDALAGVEGHHVVAAGGTEECLAAGARGQALLDGVGAEDRHRKRFEGHCHHPARRPGRRARRRHDRLVAAVDAVEVADGGDEHGARGAGPSLGRISEVARTPE